MRLLWRNLEPDVGHLSDKVATHLLAGTITVELLIQTSLIWVLPESEGVVAWHHDGGTLVVPTIAVNLPELGLCFLLSFLDLDRVDIASAIVICVDVGNRRLSWLRLDDWRSGGEPSVGEYPRFDVDFRHIWGVWLSHVASICDVRRSGSEWLRYHEFASV